MIFHQSGLILNTFFSLLVVLGERVLREKTQTFLGKLLGHALVTVKRSFDRFINEHIEEIQERSIKPTKKQGILWFVKDFEQLANLAETIFEKGGVLNFEPITCLLMSRYECQFLDTFSFSSR